MTPKNDAAQKPAVEPEDLAVVIRRVGESFDRLRKSGLNRHAIVTLVSADSKVGKRAVEDVLDSLGNLAQRYTVQPKAKA